jgi:hypothetical protein
MEALPELGREWLTAAEGGGKLKKWFGRVGKGAAREGGGAGGGGRVGGWREKEGRAADGA